MLSAMLVLTSLVACGRKEEAVQPAPAPPPTAERSDSTATATAPAPAPAPAPGKVIPQQRTPEEVVEEFGRRLKLVPTTASPEIASSAIREHYTGLVHPRLLNAWIANPGKAPGRPVSSPWPERLDIQSSSRSKGDVLVKAALVEATSTGESGRTPVTLRLESSDGAWQIAFYEAGAPSAGDSGNDGEAAAKVVRDYYRAIDAKDFDRAYAFWGPNGPPGQSREEFARGFAQTESVAVTTGEPSRVEAAAGSRYITVPVTVTATTTSGKRQRFAGTYILRRSVVDGATEAQRTWHLERASLREVARQA